MRLPWSSCTNASSPCSLSDDFVPFAHLEKNFRAKWHGYKEKWEVPGAVHANSYAKYPEEYTRRVENFLKTVHNMIEDGSIYDK